MSIRDHHNRKVSFNTKEELGDKLDKLAVMIGKLALRDSRTNRQFKPQIHQGRGRGQNRNESQRNYQNRYRSNSKDRGQYRQDRSRPRFEQNYTRGYFRGNVRSYGRQSSRGEYRNNYRNESYDRSRNKSRERLFCRIMTLIKLEVQAIVGPGQNPEIAQIGDTIHCYKCREYDHFARDCPTSREEKEIEQLQQMLNLGDEQTIMPSTVMYGNVL